jgi:arogenate dehydrogenase (NADP+), plant
VGFGRFGQFIAKTFTKYGNVVVTSRTDYTAVANSMNVEYVPMNQLDQFLAYNLDVIVIATSIVSFESTIQMLSPYIVKNIKHQKQLINGQIPNPNSNDNADALLRGPLIVDVLSVKEHARQIMIKYLPPQCDILCTHPMFGPDSGKDGWYNLNFVYEKTRIDQVLLLHSKQPSRQLYTLRTKQRRLNETDRFIDEYGTYHSVHEGSDAHVEGMDRMERFLSIWEEEGCKMVPMSCADHDAYAANSQFITHLIGRVLASQGLESTPIDTAGFQSVLRLVTNTVSDSFDLFYGLYKYNRKNSYETIQQLQAAMNDVVTKLQQQEDDKIVENSLVTSHETKTEAKSSSREEDR